VGKFKSLSRSGKNRKFISGSGKNYIIRQKLGVNEEVEGLILLPQFCEDEPHLARLQVE